VDQLADGKAERLIIAQKSQERIMKAARSLLILVLSALLAVVCDAVHAQATAAGNYPNHPIRILVSFTAGGGVDTLARAVAQHLTERLGQPVVVDNRPGANGSIALEAAAKAQPDGYTLVMAGQSNLVLLTASRKILPYDPLRDFASVGTLFVAPFYLVVHPSVPVRTVQEFVALARSQPGKINYGSIGVGSGHHLVMEMFATRAKVKLMHVPYKGSGPAMADLLSGHIQAMFEGAISTFPQIRTGKLRALASSGLQRTQAMPSLPTVAESGMPGFDMVAWFGLATQAAVPRQIVNRLNRETVDMLRSPATREKFAAYNFEPIPSTPEEMDQRVRSEIPTYTKVMREAGIEPE